MQPYQVLIASVLKPVDDIRMSRKIGLSVARLTNARVHVAGHCTSYDAQLPPLTLHPIYCFGRLSLNRITANFKLLKLGFWLKPRLLIIETHELLPAATVMSLVLKTKVVYDVQENYYRNIRFTAAYPAGIRVSLAALVRAMEYASRPAIDYYLLAEKCYLKELDFVQHKAIVLQNKYLGLLPDTERALPVSVPNAGPIRLLYSGTIAATYGIFDAINLAIGLHKANSRFELHIIGYAPQLKVLEKVKALIAGNPFITLTGGDKPVPHQQIVKAISEAHFGLLPYQPNLSTANCIPTKLYEYLANCLPVISAKNPLWNNLIEKWQAGVSINFMAPDFIGVLQTILGSSYYKIGRPENVAWKDEEPKFAKLLNKLGLKPKSHFLNLLKKKFQQG